MSDRARAEAASRVIGAARRVCESVGWSEVRELSRALDDWDAVNGASPKNYARAEAAPSAQGEPRCPGCEWDGLNHMDPGHTMTGACRLAAAPPPPREGEDTRCATCGGVGFVKVVESVEPGVYYDAGEPCDVCEGTGRARSAPRGEGAP